MESFVLKLIRVLKILIHIPDKRKDIFPLIVSIIILLFIIICAFIMSKAAVYYVPGVVSDYLDLDLEKIGEIMLMFI